MRLPLRCEKRVGTKDAVHILEFRRKDAVHILDENMPCIPDDQNQTPLNFGFLFRRRRRLSLAKCANSFSTA